MFRPIPFFFMGGPNKIVHKINSNYLMDFDINYYCDENVYIKPNIKYGLLDKPYMGLTPTQSYGERQ